MKRWKRLVILSCALVAVLGAYGITALVARKIEENSAVTQTGGTFAVAGFEAGNIARLEWTYAAEACALACENGAWALADDADFPVNQQTAQALAEALAGLTASRKLTGGVEDADYGLDAPAATVRATLASGETVTFAQGDQNGVTGEYYLRVSGGESGVYASETSLQSAFALGLNDLFVREELPQMDEIRAITLETADAVYALTYAEDAASADYTGAHHWFLSASGRQIALDESAVNDLLEQIQSFEWYDLAQANADADALAQYGFTAPALALTVDYAVLAQTETGETASETRRFQLEFADDALGDTRYARLSLSAHIYRVTDDLFSLAAAFTPFDYADGAVLGVNADLVTGIEASFSGETRTLTRTAAAATPAQAEAEETEAFLSILNALNALYGAYEEGLEAESGAQALLRVTIAQANERFSQIELCFSPLSADSYLFTRSDGAALRVDAGEVDALIRALKYLPQ